MEDVSLGEFIAWLWSSNLIIWAVLAAVAVKVIRDNMRSDRRIKAKMQEIQSKKP